MAIAYVPTNMRAPYFNRMGYRLRPEAHDPYKIRRIKAICCGKSVRNECPAGARVGLEDRIFYTAKIPSSDIITEEVVILSLCNLF